MPIFPEISWSSIRSKLIRSHKNFTVNNATLVIEEKLNNIDLTIKDLKERLASLEIIDISRHSKRKIWYGYKLMNLDKPANNLGKREMQKNIRDEFHSVGLNMTVKVLTYDDITFIYIKENKKKIQRNVPVFFALFLEQKYIFCSRKMVPNHFIDTMTVVLGYSKIKKIKLMGKDLKSLIRMLWIKQQGALDIEDINQPAIYKASDPKINANGINFMQDKQRRNYIERHFGKDPPILESLVINGPSVPIQHHNKSSILSNYNIHMNWEFRSHNTAKFLMNLVEKRIILPPLPDYVSNLMITGKNELRLEV